MRRLSWLVIALTFAGASVPGYADPDKNESGHGRGKYERHGHKGGEHKEEYWDGNCKVERKWERNGKFKEERKCEGPSHSRGHAHPAAGPGVVVQPPGIVIQPPAIVIR